MIFASERLAEAMRGIDSSAGRFALLDELSRRAADVFGARIWFTEIIGLRWSYIAGIRPAAPANEVERTNLEGNLGLVSNGWGEMTTDERVSLAAFASELARDSLGSQ